MRLTEFRDQLLFPFIPDRLETTMSEGLPWHDGTDHYDFAWAMFQAKLSGLPGPWDHARKAGFIRYAVNQVLKYKTVSGHHAYSRGSVQYYLDTGDKRGQDVARILNPTGGPDGYLDGLQGQDVSREVAFMLMNALWADKAGLGENPLVHTFAQLGKIHLRQWCQKRSYGTFVKPFMVAITCLALFEYLEKYADAEIVPLIGEMMDWLMANCWYDQHPTWKHGAFDYMDVDGPTAAPDLPSSVKKSGETLQVVYGGPELSDQDGFYKHTGVMFTSGVMNNKDSYRVIDYIGAERKFVFQKFYHPKAVAKPGDLMIIRSLMDRDGGKGPAADLNHFLSPVAARLYLLTGAVKWRVMHDKIFDGGAMCYGPPYAQKQYNEAVYAGLRGVADRSVGSDKPVSKTRRFLVTIEELV